MQTVLSTLTAEAASSRAAGGCASELERRVDSTKDGLDGGGAGGVLRIAEGVTLILGDCADIVRELEGVDVVITDPPYGIEFRNKEWDKEVPRIAFALPFLFDRVAIIMGTEAAWQLPKPKWTACWARPASCARSLVGGFSHWSPILLYGECKLSVDFRSWHAIAHAYKEGSYGAEHPSPKPEALMMWLVSELAQEGETVLDPFMGSGTTGIACIRTGRKFIGIERDPAHFKTAELRIRRELEECVFKFPKGQDGGGQQQAFDMEPRQTPNDKLTGGTLSAPDLAATASVPSRAASGSANVSGARARSGAGGEREENL